MASKKSRLEAAAAEATKIFFSGADDGTPEGVSETSQDGTKTVTTTKRTRTKAKAVETVKAPQAGAGSVVFSFRANPDDVTRWKSYAKARQGVTLAEIGAAAMEEYMARHKLADAEAAIYDLEIKKADMLKGL